MTLAEAQEQLIAWEAASLAVASNQSYSIKDRSLTRADASDILSMINYWSSKVALLTRVAAGESGSGFVLAKFNH